ncbi:hypothetical protein IE53DRAFT_389738 [Violaceomyces palustris]|uniref:Uncharacterized protein n=1 Tax=Violaceomyces palustris TaxID=1673888 RepID=A0ACD0NQK7_9BASI|nr:hypothetical protein IE53DRAFT_389738 [Violaceomyces palustris]
MPPSLSPLLLFLPRSCFSPWSKPLSISLVSLHPLRGAPACVPITFEASFHQGSPPRSLSGLPVPREDACVSSERGSCDPPRARSDPMPSRSGSPHTPL